MPYIFGKLWHLAIIWAIRKAFQCILQGVRFLLANHTRISPTSDNDSYVAETKLDILAIETMNNYDSNQDKAKGKIPFSSLGSRRLFQKYMSQAYEITAMWEICPEDYILCLCRFRLTLKMHKDIYTGQKKQLYFLLLQRVTLLRMYIIYTGWL